MYYNNESIVFLATLGTFPGTGNKLVVAWAFSRDHMGVIGTVVTYVHHNCANNSHMVLGPRLQLILVWNLQVIIMQLPAMQVTNHEFSV